MFEDVSYVSHPTYQVAAIILVINFATAYFSLKVISYLRSKPLLSQTVMDYSNMAVFYSIIINSFVKAVAMTATVFLSDSGEAIGLVMGWLNRTFNLNLMFQLLANTVIQLSIFKNPSRLENSSFETGVKCLTTCLVPSYVVIFNIAGLFCWFYPISGRDGSVIAQFLKSPTHNPR